MISTPVTPTQTASPSETDATDSGDDTVPDTRVGEQIPTRAAATERVESRGANVVLRQPRVSDGPHIHQLVSECPPLDLNSLYSYLLLCEHHASTCVVAESGEGVCGFVSAYVRPDQPDVIFVWQVAVHESARGTGLARRMLLELLNRDSMQNVRYLETTVGPENVSSRRMFGAVAAHHGATIQERLLFASELFGAGNHEDECLLRIGPINTHNYQGTKS